MISKKEKAGIVEKTLADEPIVDITELRKLALSVHGYANDEIRRKVWPLLLGLDPHKKNPKPERHLLESHRDYSQVVLDVDRSMRRFPPAIPVNERDVLQKQLTTLIMKVLYVNQDLHYYQGFHDICVTFLLVLGKELSYSVVNALCQSHLRDFMDVDMNRTRNMLNYLYPILRKKDPELYQYMEKAVVGNIFCLSWLITWYGHVLDNPRQTVRLYDYFLASHPLMPIYVAASIVIYRRKEVLAEDCEMCFIHSLLSKVPDSMPIEDLITQAQDMFTLYPPPLLARQAKLEYKRSKALTNFASLESSFGHTRPRFKVIAQADKLYTDDQTNLFLKYSVLTLTAAVSVALFATQYAVRDMW